MDEKITGEERIAGEVDGDCQWFLFCHQPAIDQREHAILGVVPVCRDHTDKPED